MTEKSELPPSLIDHIPWEDGSNPIWPTTTFFLRRNLAKSLFPQKMSESQLIQTEDSLCKAAMGAKDLESPQCFKAETLRPVDKEFLFEHFLCSEGFQNTGRGQGFIVDASTKILAMVNIQDHLQLQFLDTKGEWEKTWNHLSNIVSSIGEKLDYAYSQKFGFMTSDPNYSGTGLTTSAFLHLPALIHSQQLEDVLAKQREEGVDAAGMQGTLEDLVGDILVVRNHYTLGLTEDDIIHSTHSTAMKLAMAEKTLRDQIRQQDNPVMKDHVSRAYGLLLHSYQLQTKEALDALSMLKFGLDLGWLIGTTHSRLNDIFFKCRRAHLLFNFKETEAGPEALLHKRAEFIHKELQGIELKI
jgi:protein arginine kinase